MQAPDFERARRYVLDRLERELSPKLLYHSIAHTRDDVLPAVERLAEYEGITDPQDLLVLRTAALYHDFGFIETYANHEAASIRIAAQTLPDFGYNPQQIEQICQLILATEMPQNPVSLLGRVLADADLDILGRQDFVQRNKDLYNELASMGIEISPADWYTSQIKLLRAHRYFTSSANAIRQPGKERNLERIEELLPRARQELLPPGPYTRAEYEAVLRRMPLFQSLPAAEIVGLAESLRPLEFDQDSVLFLEGDPGDHFYIILDGAVEICTGLGSPDEHRLELLASGDFFGEMSLLSQGGLRSASARVAGKSRLLEMTRSDFDSLLDRNTHLAYEFARLLRARLTDRPMT